MSWVYEGRILTSSADLPDSKPIGFIYLITQLSTGKRYIGRKLLTKAGRKTVKGVSKKIRLESDWLTYWSSSPKLLELIKEVGEQDFKKEIISFVSSKGMMVYAEEAAIYIVGALESDQWFNDNIRSKVYRSWCKPDEAFQLRQRLKELTL